MADITLISGSTLGGAEYVAEHLAEKLEDAGFSTETLHGPLLEDLPTDGVWLLITSTHGAGDLPDNLQPLYDELLEQQPDLSNVRFGAVGIGSREYDTFCGAIEKVEAADLVEQNSWVKRSRSTSSIMTFRRIQPRSGSRNGKIYSKTIKDRANRCG
jgi:MioC protein